MSLRGSSIADGLFARETGLRNYRSVGARKQQQLQRELLQCLRFQATPVAIPLPPATDTAGLPIVAKFNKNPAFNNGQLLAVGGEEGFVTIANTENVGVLQRGIHDGSWRPRAHWPCHRNSIFDLAWAKNDSVIYTASGHQQVGVWDTDTARGLAVAEGHDGSVKSVSPLHFCEDIFATGARDGRIMLWDARCPGFSGVAQTTSRRINAGSGLDGAPVLSPIWVQEGAHTRSTTVGGRASSRIAKPAPVTVTSVAFVPYSYLLASAGAHDTVVKLWDLRMHGLPFCELELPKAVAGAGAGRGSATKGKAAGSAAEGVPHEVAAYCCPTRGTAVGVTHITVSNSGDRLLVSCLDSQHHLLSISHLEAGPVVSWCAPPPAVKGSFYMRSSFSPCDDYILCGSRDCGAHIWCASDPQRPPIELPHEHEVTGVAWCSGDWGKVATCSDSGEARLWTLSRIPAYQAWAEDENAPGVALVEKSGVDDGKPLMDMLSEDLSTHHDVGVARPLVGLVASGRSASAPITPAAGNPVVRRMVQQRLNMERTARLTPVPEPEPVPEIVQVAAGSLAPDTGQAEEDHLRLRPTVPGLAGMLPAEPASPAALHASALRSPIGPPPPLPPLYPGSAQRRRSMLPPVPVFSPAVNRWQLQPSAQAALGSPHVSQRPERTRSAPEATTADHTAPVFDLEEAIRGLPQVCTQSPVRPKGRFDGGLEAVEGFRSSTPPPPEVGQMPTSSRSLLSMRAPSPHATPGSHCRSRSRIDAFSPSRSSGSGPSVSSGSGGALSGSFRPASAPGQGVVGQIMRNSPRPGSRSGAVDMSAMSPRFRRTTPRRHNRSDSPVQRQLFTSLEDAEQRRPEGLPFPPPRPPSGWAPGQGLFDRDEPASPPRSGAGFIAAVDHLLLHPGAAGSPRVDCEPMSVAYHVCDGADVGPALRFRALYPDSSGPFDESLAAFEDALAGQREDGERDFTHRLSTAPLRHALESLEAPAPDPDEEERGQLVVRRAGDEDLVGWPLRRIGSGEHQLANHVIDDGDDSDWEFDPYSNKENTPPPEELDGPVLTLPTSSASAGAAAIPSSPRPLPSSRVTPPSPAPMMRSRSEAPRLLSPFEDARPFAETALGAAVHEAFVAATAQSIEEEPSISAGIAYGDENAPDGSPARVIATVASLGRDWLRTTDGPPIPDGVGIEDRVADTAHGLVSSGSRRTTAEVGPNGHQLVDNPTPTKRQRRTYDGDSDRGSPAGSRSPSPTRRVRTADMFARPAPTPGPRSRSGIYAGAMPSPCVRGPQGSRGGGGSRLAPAAGAGYLISAAVGAAAGIGSESPAPKVATVSRTGGRATAASVEFHRRRAEEDRDDALMSPFGFGPLTSGPPPMSTTKTGRDTGVSRRLSSRFAHTDGPGPRRLMDMEEENGQAGGDGSAEGVQGSVRSLTCIFETQVQEGASSLMVPCTYPVEDGGRQEENAHEMPQRYGPPPMEERTVASPALFDIAARLLAAGQGKIDNGPRNRRISDGGENEIGLPFGGAYPCAARHPSQQQDSLDRERCDLLPLPLDESSRCFPADFGGAHTPAADVGALLAGWGGGDRMPPVGPVYGPRNQAHEPRLNFAGLGLHSHLSLSPDAEGHQAHENENAHRRPPESPIGLPRTGVEAPAANAAAPGRGVNGLPGHTGKKTRQQTLQQCWGAPIAAVQMHQCPLGVALASPARPPAARALGPTGLTSPRYFR